MEVGTLITFALACFALAIVPGPTVTVIIANSLKSGVRAGLMNVAGTQLGLAIMIFMLAFGLEFVVTQLGFVFEILRWVGAAYLIWLGIQMWRSDGDMGAGKAVGVEAGKSADKTFFLQGFLVIWSNPKALVFFGAFIPQFIDPAGDPIVQTFVLGGVFMLVGMISDTLYAVFAGRAGAILSRKRVRLVEMVSGTALIGGGIWLALTNTVRAS